MYSKYTKIAIVFVCWLANDILYYIFPKNVNG